MGTACISITPLPSSSLWQQYDQGWQVFAKGWKNVFFSMDKLS